MSVSLAEPRRRQKWTLNPRGNLWANDESKFGQKLMEKMGWEKGNGLGANQDGRVENIKIKHKDNSKGVGFEGHDDTWLAHQDDFQAVLAALNVEHGEAGKDLTETEKKVSLEAISRKSKRRVHYQKFVKGKDLDNYSKDDLECILGTKSDKMKSTKGTETVVSVDVGEDIKKADDSGKFIQSSSNYQDYFAKKMAAMKAQGKYADIPSFADSTLTNTNCDTQGLGAEQVQMEPEKEEATPTLSEEQSLDLDASVKKKKKKSKKNKEEVQEVSTEVKEEALSLEGSEEESVKKKKKKSKKTKQDLQEKPTEVEEETSSPTLSMDDSEEPESSIKKKKKKSKKIKAENLSKEEAVSSVEELEEPRPKKSKKSKKEKEQIDECSEEKMKKKKCKSEMKKSKKEEKDRESSESIDDSGCDDKEIKNKKNKKSKKEKNKVTTKRKSEELSEEVVPSKKRKKNGEETEGTNKCATQPSGFNGSNLMSIPGYGN